MVSTDMNVDQRTDMLEKQVIADERVQYELQELNSLLEHIADTPVADTPEILDSTWRIEDPDVDRWLITLEGQVNLERIARFRRSLLAEEDVSDAQVVRIENGQIQIRVITNGGLPMGPLELAVGKLTAENMSVQS